MNDTQPEIIERQEQHAVVMRIRAAVQDLPRVFGEAYGELGAYLGESGVEPSGMPFAAYHNLDMHDMDVEIGFQVPRALPGRGRIQAGTIPGGSWITAVHIGPYDSLQAVYDTLMQEMQEKGLEPTGVAYEFYFSPPDTPPDEIKTEVGFPLK
jgi:effector-binding domain-containing protein